MKKKLWIVAGPNGAGKTTLVTRYNKHNLYVLNPDDIAKALSPFAPEKAAIAAGRKAVRDRNQLFKDHQSFILETTFSGKGALSVIKAAIKQDYEVTLIFVCLKSPALCVSRVGMRVLDGGHSVPIPDIVRRYFRAGENLENAIPLVDDVVLFDNSKSEHQLVAKIEQGKNIHTCIELPHWVSKFLPRLESP